MAAKLAELDREQDCKISHEELRLAVEALVREENNNRLVLLALAVVLLVGAVAGSVYGVVTLTQELKVRVGVVGRRPGAAQAPRLGQKCSLQRLQAAPHACIPARTACVAGLYQQVPPGRLGRCCSGVLLGGTGTARRLPCSAAALGAVQACPREQPRSMMHPGGRLLTGFQGLCGASQHLYAST
jgi:hypothetical protein